MAILVLLFIEKQAEIASGRARDMRQMIASCVHETMNEEPVRIKILVGAVTLDAELKSTRTAKAIYDLLPVEAAVNAWGDEFYFKIPLIKDHRETATLKVAVGDIAYWGNGQSVAIFFGRTPVSTGADPVPADRVNIVGKINGDATALRSATGASRIRIEKV